MIINDPEDLDLFSVFLRIRSRGRSSFFTTIHGIIFFLNLFPGILSSKSKNMFGWVVVSCGFNESLLPLLPPRSNLIIIFQMGWNHHLTAEKWRWRAKYTSDESNKKFFLFAVVHALKTHMCENMSVNSSWETITPKNMFVFFRRFFFSNVAPMRMAPMNFFDPLPPR